MPRYEYRDVRPTPDAEAAFLEWIAALQRPPRGLVPLRACLVLTAVGFALGFVAAAMLGLFVR